MADKIINWKERAEKAEQQLDEAYAAAGRLTTAYMKSSERALKAEQERDQLAAHVERLKTAWDENADSATTPNLTDAMEAVFESSPPTSLANRDAINQASGAVEFVSWLAKECESNGEVGEMFGMTLSGFTGDSRVAPNLRAARAVLAEAKKLADWKLEQVPKEVSQ